MTSYLENLNNRVVSVITGDGRNIVGVLRGFDQLINIALEDCHERIFSSTSGVEQVQIGLYIIRGDNIAIIAEIDEELDKRIDYSEVRADPLVPIWTN